MAKDKIRYLVERKRKNGQSRYYWQPDTILRKAGWKMQTLSSTPAEAKIQAMEYNEAVDQWRANLIKGPVDEKPGSVDALIAAYKKSRHYTELADRTKKDYAHYLTAISAWAGDIAAAAITAKSVQDLYEAHREASPRKAMYLIQVLRLLFSYGERVSFIPKNTNPATKPKIDYKSKKGRLWSREDVARFVETADALGLHAVGTAIRINEWMGQRKGDLIGLKMNAYQGGAIHLRQSKTGAEVFLPVDMVPELKARIEMQIARNRKASVKRKLVGMHLLPQRSRQRYTVDGFTSSFDTVLTAAAKTWPGMKGLVFKDLRHTAVTRLAEAGATVPQIASITGHELESCQEIIDRYNIRTMRMAQEAFQRRIDFETNKAEGQ